MSFLNLLLDLILLFRSKTNKLMMKLIIVILVVLCLSPSSNGVLIKDVGKYFDMLKQFCMHNKHKFCNQNEIEMSKTYLGSLKNEIRDLIALEKQEARRLEKERRRNEIKMKKMEQKFREHFLDRHI
jgi:hypothetical protein